LIKEVVKIIGKKEKKREEEKRSCIDIDIDIKMVGGRKGVFTFPTF